MISLLYSLSLLTSSLASSLPSARGIDISSYPSKDVIQRDVVIIGGGSSGTHAAISLKDKGYSTLIVEKSTRLGGNTETYLDPATQTTIDYGVIIFHNEAWVKQYFNRFSIALTQDINTINASYSDFRTGKPVNAIFFTPEQTQAAVAEYALIISQWPSLDRGMFLPEPVPEDLLLPFASFTKKHNIDAIIPLFYQYNPGLGDILTIPTIEIVRVMGLSLLRQFSSGFLTTSRHNNSELYAKAQSELLAGGNLLLNSQVTHVQRTAQNGVTLEIQTPSSSGAKKLVVAKTLLISIPPKLDFVGHFDLSEREKGVFETFINAGYYASVVRDTGLGADVSLYNADSNKPFAIPDLPAVYSIFQTGVVDLHTVYYGTARGAASKPVSDGQVKEAIVKSIKTLQAASGGGGKSSGKEPKFEAFSGHVPFYLQVEAQDTRAGFYKELYGLQGERNTFWTGAAWRAHDSSCLWRFNDEVVLPALIQRLQG